MDNLIVEELLQEIRSCQLCRKSLPHPPRPVVQAGDKARLLIVGQAPGRKVQDSGVPWNDASGERLRDWLGVTSAMFYGDQVAIVPMGFCFPGSAKSGDLPPRAECAPTWHSRLLPAMPNIQLTLLIGTYAQRYYLPDAKPTLTQTVKHFKDWLPNKLPLPHPSPRNNIWLRKNPWFEREVLPELRDKINQLGLT